MYAYISGNMVQYILTEEKYSSYSEDFKNRCVDIGDNSDGVRVGMTYSNGAFSPLAVTPATAEDAAAEKIAELSEKCEETIIAGVDVGDLHYSLTLADQLNLESLKTTIMGGATAVPYHADGELCAMYSAEDFLTVYNACALHKIGQTTYFNQLRAYVNSLTEIEEITAVTYGQELTGDYLEAYNTIMEAMQGA
ncbi:MAG: hypothetical protein LUI05_03040 [Oscillospiraceae bacterium]|nr:hypothetical protein [Oscillospiraceae bacterium]